MNRGGVRTLFRGAEFWVAVGVDAGVVLFRSSRQH
jgi:hypothetical protein